MPRKLSELAQKGTLLAWCMTSNAEKKGSSLIDVTGAFTTQVDRCNFTIVVPQLSQRYTSGTAQWKAFGSHPISMVIQSVWDVKKNFQAGKIPFGNNFGYPLELCKSTFVRSGTVLYYLLPHYQEVLCCGEN